MGGGWGGAGGGAGLGVRGSAEGSVTGQVHGASDHRAAQVPELPPPPERDRVEKSKHERNLRTTVCDAVSRMLARRPLFVQRE